MWLADHTSKWNMDLYIAVDREIPGMRNVYLSGTFQSRVYEGAFRETGKWCADFAEDARTKGIAIRKQFLWYTTCPTCAKKFGKNYVVILGEL
jgi:hypothetical protein